jgi:hypothetical protein
MGIVRDGMSEVKQDEGASAGGFVPSRRTVLALGAVAASTVVTVRPAFAQTAGSVLNCEIPVPSPDKVGNYIASDGTLVPPGTPGAFAPAPRPLTGEEVRAMMNHGPTPSGIDPDAAQAYLNYIRRLQAGTSGFTCFASLQMPR